MRIGERIGQTVLHATLLRGGTYGWGEPDAPVLAVVEVPPFETGYPPAIVWKDRFFQRCGNPEQGTYLELFCYAATVEVLDCARYPEAEAEFEAERAAEAERADEEAERYVAEGEAARHPRERW